MKKTLLIFFLSLMVTGFGFDDIYAKSKKVTRPKTKSVIKKREKKLTKTVESKSNDQSSSSVQRPTSSSIIKRSTDKSKKTETKLTPVQKSAVDKKLAKHKALKGKKFKSKKEAEDAYRKSLASQKYDTRPQQRPDHVPEYYEHNGRRVQTEFYNGQYGYYASPGVFRPYTTKDFIVDMLVINALTTPRTAHVVSSTPVVRERRVTNENDVRITVIVLIFILILIVGGVGAFIFFSKRGS
jgi:hypothetical protein